MLLYTEICLITLIELAIYIYTCFYSLKCLFIYLGWREHEAYGGGGRNKKGILKRIK